jgi:hypothetical protein
MRSQETDEKEKANILVSSYDKWLVIDDDKKSTAECLGFILINRQMTFQNAWQSFPIFNGNK